MGTWINIYFFIYIIYIEYCEMGKTRSSRRMRNCKSRTKRGGLFGCINCSETKKDLKVLQDRLARENKVRGTDDYFNEIYHFYEHFLLTYLPEMRKIVGTLDREVEIRDLYIELNSEDRKEMLNAILTFLKNTDTDEKNIRIVKFEDKEFILVALNYLKDATKPIFSEKNKQESFQEFRTKLTLLLEQAKTDADVKKFYEEREATQRQSIAASTTGGKSRRRHRRGSTLHKRIKSSKVRKMRYSRTRR